MTTTKLITLGLISLFFLSLFLPSYSPALSRKVTINWEATAGVKKYHIEIRSGSSMIRSETSSINSYSDALEPGRYEIRVGVYNKFDKIASWSDWQELIVKRPDVPVYHSVSPETIDKKQNDFSIKITGENFFYGTKVKIFSKKQEIPVNKIKAINEQELSVALNSKEMKDGSYSLLIENPGNKTITINNFLTGRFDRPSISPFSNNYFSAALSPYFIGQNDFYNRVIQVQSAVSADFFIHRLELFYITPGIKIAYMRLYREQSPVIQGNGIRIDPFLSINFNVWKKIHFRTMLGTGLSYYSVQANQAQTRNWRELDIFGSFDFIYTFNRYLSAFVGWETLIIVDNSGSLAMDIPRIGLEYRY